MTDPEKQPPKLEDVGLAEAKDWAGKNCKSCYGRGTQTYLDEKNPAAGLIENLCHCVKARIRKALAAWNSGPRRRRLRREPPFAPDRDDPPADGFID